jgi:polyisoprenoid-binding protein YceI
MTALAWLLAAPCLAMEAPRPVWLLAQAPAAAAARPYGADLARSTVRFRAMVNAFPLKEVKATFQRFSFVGAFDASSPQNSRARIVIDMGSVVSDTFGVSDTALRTELEAAAHPEAGVEIVAVRRGGRPDSYEADAVATFKGVQYASTLDVKVVRFPSHLRLLGTYSTRPDAQGRKAEIAFSLHVAPL